MVSGVLRARLGSASKRVLDEITKFLDSQGWRRVLNWLRLGLNNDFNALMNYTTLSINGERHLQSILNQLVEFLKQNNADNLKRKLRS